MEDERRENLISSADTVSEGGITGFFAAVYYVIYRLGLGIINTVNAVFGLVFAGIFRRIAGFFRRLPEDIKEERRSAVRRFKRKVIAARRESAAFRAEIKRGLAGLRKARGSRKKHRRLLSRYIKLAVTRHKGLLKTVFNTALPVAALVVFVLTVQYWKTVTIALEVTYGSKSLGYIGSEAVYMEALDLIEEKTDDGAYAFGTDSPVSSLNARYSLKPVTLDRLNDANTICDKVIESSASNLTNACGIYIDGEFVGAVKNEADAKTVFDTYLAAFAPKEDEDFIVDYVQNIDYVQGLYSDTGEIIIDAPALESRVTDENLGIFDYMVRSGDYPALIAERNDMSIERLYELNPDYDWDNMTSGDTIKIEKLARKLNIRKTVTSSENVAVDYDTVKTKDKTKFQGYEKVTRKGVKGVNRVTTKRIYVDGELVDEAVDIQVVRAPVSELKTVGAKSYYGGGDVGSASSYGFLWPAPSCHYISSPYGYRRSGFHKGVDLCRSDGGANGTAVIAAKSGTVEFAGWNTIGFGNMVLINHGNGVKTRYAHMQSGSICVSAGEYVYAGQQLGRVGSTGNSTGPHLHFEVIIYGDRKNPMNYLR